MRFVAGLFLTGLLSACTTPAAIGPNAPEENYAFLAVTDGPCIPKVGVGINPKYRVECQQMMAPKRYRGTWYVAFETSIFKPSVTTPCIEGVTNKYCPDLVLEGKALPWACRWSCARMFALDFIGRRNAWPGVVGSGLDYRVVVDRVISAKRLPDPYDENCDPKLHPELNSKQ